MPVPDCCSSLTQALGSKVSFPGNASYAFTLASYWSLQESSLNPSCIVTPLTARDVSTTVSILSEKPHCHFAIKGQTHAPAAGFANIDCGVTIDMTPLNTITVNKDHTVASIGAGASWLDVYKYLDPLGLAVPGGRNGAVGVGGLTLGGGISYFLPRVGWTCDSVANFEIVLASGKLANANATSSPDLFRALKGGWNNFGIVTRIDLVTLSQGRILGGSLGQDISHREAVFKAVADIAAAPTYDPYASIVAGLLFNSTSQAWDLSETPIYTKPVKKPAVYKELMAIPATSNNLHITNISTLAAEPPTPPLNWLFYTGTYAASASVLSKVFDIANSTIYTFNPSEGIIWSIAFEPLPTIATAFGQRKGNKNSLGVSPKDGNGIVLLVSALWPNAAVNDAVDATAQDVMRKINKEMEACGLVHAFQYINYAGPSQGPIGSYGEANVARLREASKKYDPKGVFQRQVPGGFKLW